MGKQDGFTIVETLVAIIVFAIFFTFLMQGFIAVQTQRVKTMRYQDAQNLAISNLKRYPTRAELPGEIKSDTCTSERNLVDLTANANPQGKVIATSTSGVVSTTLTLPSTTRLPSSATQEIRAFYPQGCGTGKPIQLKAEVKFDSETVTRATYIN